MRKLRLPGNQKGVSLIILAVAMTTILAFTALIVDIGAVVAEREKMQTAVDAAAIAGAYELPDTAKAITAAKHYAELNGVDPEDVAVTFTDSNSTVNVNAKKTVKFVLARVLGINSTDTDTMAAATLTTIGGPFNYALFSGGTTIDLRMNGSGSYIDGSVHSNKGFRANGNSLTVTGAIEACQYVDVSQKIDTIGSRVPNAPFIEMPDFSDQMRTLAQKAGTMFVGDKTFSGTNYTVTSPLYVEGNVYVNKGSFKGQGAILATGNIIFNGGDLYADAGDAICFYSINGDIIINGSGANVSGILYAPKGKIDFNGSGQTIHGRAIADNITFDGSGATIVSSATDLTSLPTYGVQLIK